jgi:pimeloyl-ACP methyl ester carboxylesterase
MIRIAAALAALLTLAACVPQTAFEPEPVLPQSRLLSHDWTVPSGVDVSDLDLEERRLTTGYEVLGHGAPVVMVHGIGGGSSRFQYRLNARPVANAGYRVYAPDLIGFGASSRPVGRSTQDLLVAQLESFLVEVVEEPAVLVANGLAAAHAVRVARERPDLVSGLVLITPTGLERLDRPQTEARRSQFALLTGPLGELLYFTLLDEEAQEFFLVDAYASEASLTPEIRAVYDRELRAPNAQWIVFSFVTGNLDQDLSEAWPEVEQPTLIVWGEDAETTPASDALAFLEARPSTDFVAFEDAKLLPNEDRPEAFNAAVLDYLARLGW